MNAIARERGPIDGVEAIYCCQRIDGRVGSDYLRGHWYAVSRSEIVYLHLPEASNDFEVMVQAGGWDI